VVYYSVARVDSTITTLHLVPRYRREFRRPPMVHYRKLFAPLTLKPEFLPQYVTNYLLGADELRILSPNQR
jgi:hypothetical protein